MPGFQFEEMTTGDMKELSLHRGHTPKQQALSFTASGHRLIADFRRSLIVLSTVNTVVGDHKSVLTSQETPLLRFPYAPELRWCGGSLSEKSAAEIVAAGARFSYGARNKRRRKILQRLCSYVAHKTDVEKIVITRLFPEKKVRISTDNDRFHYIEGVANLAGLKSAVNKTLIPVLPASDRSNILCSVSGSADEAPQSGHETMDFYEVLCEEMRISPSLLENIQAFVLSAISS